MPARGAERSCSAGAPVTSCGTGKDRVLEKIEVAQVATDPRSTRRAVGKVLYLLLFTAIAFTVPALPATHSVRWIVVPAVFGLQVLMLLACRISRAELVRPVWRLRWLFAFLIACYALLPPERPSDGDVLMTWRVP